MSTTTDSKTERLPTKREGMADGIVAIRKLAAEKGMAEAVTTCAASVSLWLEEERDPEASCSDYTLGFRTAWTNWFMINCG